MQACRQVLVFDLGLPFMNKQLICAALFFTVPSMAYAQHAPGVTAVPSTPMPMARPAAVAPMPVAHAVPATASHAAAHPHASPIATGRPAPHNTSRPSTSPRPNKYSPRQANPNFVPGPEFIDEAPVPGLGFDYPHFFAVHPNWQREHPSTGAIFPFVGGGLYIPVPYDAVAATENETADSNDAVAGEPANPDVYENTNPREAEPASTRVRSRSDSAPAPANTTEYVFVRRDGTVFFAVAYSWADGKLQYMTQDGLRKFASLDTLDLQATQQFNEQSGQTLTTPSL